MVSRDLNWFNRWIFNTYTVSAEGLGLYRIFASLFILFFLIPGQGWSHYQYLSSLPSDFYSPPPGPMMLLEEFPPFIVFQTVYVLIVISVLAMLIGYRTRFASILSGLFIFVLQGLIYSIGKANHEALVPMVPIIMAFSNWGNSFSVDSLITTKNQEKVQSWPLVLLSLFIGFMMFTAGFPKILGGWLDPSTHATKAHLLNQFLVNEREAFLAGFAVRVDSSFIWEFLDWATIFFEIGFLISVWKKRWFQFFLVIAVFFHFSTQMLLNISFLPNFLGYAAFLNWHKIYHQSKSIFSSMTGLTYELVKKISLTGIVLLLIIFFSVLKWISMQEVLLNNSDLMAHESIFLFCALFVVIYISLKHLFSSKSEVGNN